jgi:hypothetical protein
LACVCPRENEAEAFGRLLRADPRRRIAIGVASLPGPLRRDEMNPAWCRPAVSRSLKRKCRFTGLDERSGESVLTTITRAAPQEVGHSPIEQ